MAGVNISLKADGGKEVKAMLTALPQTLRKRVLKDALNRTAKDCMKVVWKEVGLTYAIKQKAFKDGKKRKVSITKAKESNLQATVNISSHKTELYEYKVSPASYNPKKRPDHYKGKALLKGSMKNLFKKDKKMFVVKFKSGHVTLVSRTGQPSKKDPKKEGIGTIYSPAISQLVGAFRMQKILYPKINDMLREQTENAIKRLKSRGVL